MESSRSCCLFFKDRAIVRPGGDPEPPERMIRRSRCKVLKSPGLVNPFGFFIALRRWHPKAPSSEETIEPLTWRQAGRVVFFWTRFRGVPRGLLLYRGASLASRSFFSSNTGGRESVSDPMDTSGEGPWGTLMGWAGCKHRAWRVGIWIEESVEGQDAEASVHSACRGSSPPRGPALL